MRSSTLLSSFLTALAASTATASPVDLDANASSPAAVVEKRANTVHVTFFTENNYGGKTQNFYTVRDSKCWDIAPEFSDKISSIRFPTDGSGSCRFYQHTNCVGVNLIVDTGDSLYKMGIYYNDLWSSFKCF